MSYSTSIPYLMRKKKVSAGEAKNIINDLCDKGLIVINDLNNHKIEEENNFRLRFSVESKYGRPLFYPVCENAKFIIEGLLNQKTATRKQIESMQNHGWEIEIKQKEIF